MVAATGLADAVVALRVGPGGRGDAASSVDALFHDEEIDGPLPERLRVLAFTLTGERTVVAARVAGLDDIYLVDGRGRAGRGDPAARTDPAPCRAPTGAGRAEQQLAILAVRLEMAAVYLRLVRG